MGQPGVSPSCRRRPFCHFDQSTCTRGSPLSPLAAGPFKLHSECPWGGSYRGKGRKCSIGERDHLHCCMFSKGAWWPGRPATHTPLCDAGLLCGCDGHRRPREDHPGPQRHGELGSNPWKEMYVLDACLPTLHTPLLKNPTPTRGLRHAASPPAAACTHCSCTSANRPPCVYLSAGQDLAEPEPGAGNHGDQRRRHHP